MVQETSPQRRSTVPCVATTAGEHWRVGPWWRHTPCAAPRPPRHPCVPPTTPAFAPPARGPPPTASHVSCARLPGREKRRMTQGFLACQDFQCFIPCTFNPGSLAIHRNERLRSPIGSGRAACWAMQGVCLTREIICYGPVRALFSLGLNLIFHFIVVIYVFIFSWLLSLPHNRK